MRGALEAAKIDWSRPGAPVSARHGDVYFSAADGLQETRHVFLAGNDLPEAWSNRHVFAIGETGFGTGLNFLAAWDLWRRTAPAGAHLHYLSVEGWPLTPEDMERAHRPFTELAPLARRLRAHYPHLYSGFHRLHFDDDRLTLTLLFGEAGDMLAQLDACVDAWFLDGFSPSKNPELWREDVLKRIGALTRPGGTASSFTSAGAVRRGLEAAGFEVEKAPGFGNKKHMIRARRPGTPPAERQEGRPASVIVVGAGLAGSSAAHALMRRNIDVTLIDPDPELTSAASGNPAGLVSPRPTADSSPAGRFHCTAFDYAERNLFQYLPQAFDPCGVLELAIGMQASRRYEAMATGDVLPESAMRALTAREATQIARISIPASALYFPRGGIARPPFCAAWLRGMAGLRKASATRVEHTDRGWGAVLEDGERITADTIVLACGMGAAAFPEIAPVPLNASRGQLSLAPASAESAGLAAALFLGSYVSPAVDGYHLLGATYDDTHWPPPDDAVAGRQEDHERNYRALKETLPGFPLSPPRSDWRARVAFRCTTPDRLPVCGPIPDTSSAPPEPGRPPLPAGRELLMPYKDGLYLYAGLGSRGLSTAPLLGEFLASLVCKEPLPTENVVTELLHPARFLIRSLRKAQISRHF